MSIDRLPDGWYVVYNDDGSELLEDPVTEERWFRTEAEARLALNRRERKGREVNMATNERARAAFRIAYGDSKNFMTPDTVWSKVIGGYAVELSHGSGIFTPDLYGVTVVTLAGERTELSDCFDSLDEATAYADSLREGSE